MKIYIAGHRGMVGGAILRRLRARQEAGESLELVTRTHAELDLTNQDEVACFMYDAAPDAVILAAAKVGGIHANNSYPADFLYENLMIEANVNDIALCTRNSSVDGVVEALVPLRREAGCLIGETRDLFQRSVGGTAILHNVLNISVGLSLNTLNGLPDRGGAIVDGCDNGNFHEILLLVCWEADVPLEGSQAGCRLSLILVH